MAETSHVAEPDSPENGARFHMQELMSLDNARIAQTVSFPLIQFGPDGYTEVTAEASDLPDMTELPYRTHVTGTKVLLQKEGDALVHVEFERTDLDGNSLEVGSAVWGLTLDSGRWLVSWRQFLGTDGDA